MSGACAPSEPAPWVVRAFEPDDENCIVAMWLKSYARGKDVASWLKTIGEDPEQVRRWFLSPHARASALQRDRHMSASAANDAAARERRMERYYWKFFQPMVVGLVRGCDMRVLCDPERVHTKPGAPSLILAWVCVSPGLLHYATVKQEALTAGADIAADMLGSLLGDMLDQPVSYTFEQRELARMELLPSSWKYDGRWLDGMKAIAAFSRKHQQSTDIATMAALQVMGEPREAA